MTFDYMFNHFFLLSFCRIGSIFFSLLQKRDVIFDLIFIFTLPFYGTWIRNREREKNSLLSFRISTVFHLFISFFLSRSYSDFCGLYILNSPRTSKSQHLAFILIALLFFSSNHFCL